MATQLEKIKSDLTDIADNAQKLNKRLATKNRVLPGLRDKVKEVEAELKEAEEVQLIHSKKVELENMLVWAIVKVHESEYLTLSEQLEKLTQEKKDVNVKLEEIVVDEDKIGDIIHNLQTDMNELQKDIDSVKSQYKSVKHDREVAEQSVSGLLVC